MSDSTQENTDAVVENTGAVADNTQALQDQHDDAVKVALRLSESLSENTSTFKNIDRRLLNYAIDRTRWLTRIISLMVVGLLLTIFSVVGMRAIQVNNCERDNVLRAAYVNQWQPVLDAQHEHPTPPPGPDASDEEIEKYNRGVLQLQAFEEAMLAFAPHYCPSFIPEISPWIWFVSGTSVAGVLVFIFKKRTKTSEDIPDG